MKPAPWRSNDQGWERQTHAMERPVITTIHKLVVWWDGETVLIGRADGPTNTRNMYVDYNRLHLRYRKR